MQESVRGERRGGSEAGSGLRVKTKGGPVSTSRESPAARAEAADGGLEERRGREEVVDQRV